VDASYGALAADTGTGLADARKAAALHCERVHFAAGRGVCLEAKRGAITQYTAVLFDGTFREVARLTLPGIPSRTRVSPDGRYAAFTVFVFGHSYASTEFSTETRIIDAASGDAVVANLEQLDIWKNGAPIKTPADVNFWGVTFANDSNRFYATMATGGSTYLVAGDITARRVSVITDGVECPSLSPDNTRIAYKKRAPGSGLPVWQIHVMNLATLADNAVAEPRFIDEQVEWLDDGHVLYAQQSADANSAAVTDIWSVPADGTGAPALLLRHAASPVAIRGTKSAVLARAGAERP
jgi:Tol biopolymer transport system component